MWEYDSALPPWRYSYGVSIPLVSWTVTTPPAIEPVTLQELKTYARYDGAYEDEELLGFITAARMEAEAYVGRSFITQTITAICEVPGAKVAAPMSQIVVPGKSYIKLPRPNVLTITTVKAEDADTPDTWITYAGYALDNADKRHPKLWMIDDWPDGPRLQIVYTAGYGPKRTDVPGIIRTFIKRRATAMLDNRADKMSGLSLQGIDSERIVW